MHPEPMYRHPAYQDVSNFRAYYDGRPLGAEAPPPPQGAEGQLQPPPGADITAGLLEQRDGKYYFKPEARKGALELLSTMRVVQIGGPVERVSLVPLTAEEAQALATPQGQQMIAPFLADKWVADRVAEGKVVFAPTWLFAPVEGRELAAIPSSEEQRVREAASTPAVGILSEPTGLSIAGVGTAGIVVGVVVLAGVGYYAWQSRKKRGPIR